MGAKLISIQEELKEKLDELKTGDESYGSFISRILEKDTRQMRNQINENGRGNKKQSAN